MEYSKDIILNSRDRKVNVLKIISKWTSNINQSLKKINAKKFITIITIMCAVLISADIILIYNFANTLQNML